MSWDIVFKYDLGGDELATIETKHLNYTYNCGPMFGKANNGIGLSEALDGSIAKDAEILLRRVVCEMVNNPSDYQKLNPANGWGSYEGFMKFLLDFAEECRKYPNATISIQ